MVSIRGVVSSGNSPTLERQGNILDNYKLEPLTDFERKFATENHNLVYDFLHRYGYSLEMYYDVAIFGFLKAVQIYNRREDLRNKYDFPFISQQYMRSEIGNYFRTESAKKRKPSETVVSLDVEYSETENLYNCISVAGGKTPELEIVAMEQMTELLNSLSDTQRKIVEMKIDGYNSKEIYSALEMKSSTYYVEVQRIKKVLAEMIG
ncbi:MAG: hypothetical protein K2N85_04230 [Lachnospiraceae bacterium]|nr:hypothetical protein [Lachnospiraceae bacterium]